ncbi:PREDICTED: protein transport protein sec31-like [Haliaeetus leucocephalus]|uniref:protein transport protein sec31-like n=1 Tax=Haliaeetus leucocephalus TaxID=52644 RepID=UPI00053CD353|nr:PREDICTED: protein transport protein sec31-like [Haliaeetus leucocephalus]
MLLFALVCRGNCSCQLSSASSYPHKASLPGSFSRGRRRAATRPGTAPSIRGPGPRGVSSPPRAGEGLHGLVSADRPTAAARERGPKRAPRPGQATEPRTVARGPGLKASPSIWTGAGQDDQIRRQLCVLGPSHFALRAQIGLFHARVVADTRLALPQPQPQALPAARGTDDPELVLRLTNEARSPPPPRPPPFPKAFEPTSGGGVGFGAVLLKHAAPLSVSRGAEGGRLHREASERFAAGYIQCMHEVHTFVSSCPGIDATTAAELLNHLLESMPLNEGSSLDLIADVLADPALSPWPGSEVLAPVAEASLGLALPASAPSPSPSEDTCSDSDEVEAELGQTATVRLDASRTCGLPSPGLPKSMWRPW